MKKKSMSIVLLLFCLPLCMSLKTNEIPEDLQKEKLNVQLAKDRIGGRKILEDTSKVILFKSYEHWWGDEETVLQNLGISYDRYPFSYLTEPQWVTHGYELAILSSDDNGDPEVLTQQTSSASLQNMYNFGRYGGVLLVNMADNNDLGSFIAPGPDGEPVGNPDKKFWNNLECTNFGTATVDGMQTSIFDGIDKSSSYACWTNHGNLQDAQYPLPQTSKIFWTQTFDDGEKPIMAEYSVGNGKVLLHTVTLEYWINNAGVNSVLYSNVVRYLLNIDYTIDCGVPVSNIDSIQNLSKYTPKSYKASVIGHPEIIPVVSGLTLCEKCDNTVPKFQTSYNCQVEINGNTIKVNKATPGSYVSWKVNVNGIIKYCGVCMFKIGSSKKVCGTASAWIPNTHPICPDNV